MNKYLYLIIFLFISPNAYAYIDPGSSLLLLQGVLAAIGAILIFVRHPIETIKSVYKKLKTLWLKKVN